MNWKVRPVSHERQEFSTSIRKEWIERIHHKPFCRFLARVSEKNELKVLGQLLQDLRLAYSVSEKNELKEQPGYLKRAGAGRHCIRKEWIERWSWRIGSACPAPCVSEKNELKVIPLSPLRPGYYCRIRKEWIERLTARGTSKAGAYWYQKRMNWKAKATVHHVRYALFRRYQKRMNWKYSCLGLIMSSIGSRIRNEWIERLFPWKSCSV